MPFAKINNARLWYDVMGEGEPILMHHGYTACRENWMPVAKRLSERYKVILIECRGAGESEDTDEGYTLTQLAKDVLGLLDHLKIKQVAFAGHSMGGGVGYILATQFSDRISKLILMAPIPSGGIPKIDPAVRATVLNAKHQNNRALFLEQERAGRFREDVQTEAWAEHRVDQILRVTDKHTIELAEAMIELNVEDQLVEMELPTLMLAGGADMLLEANLADFQRMPNAGLHVFSRAGHDVGVHEPEGVADAIDKFMTFGPVSTRILQRRASKS